MPRLTRAESQARNREALLLAARELFLSDGYQVTSIAKVADMAGFSTGALYSNFDSKAEMALLVLRDIQREQLDELTSVLTGRQTTAAKIDQIQAWAERAMGTGWPRLELEFALDARADSSLIAAEAERQRSAVDRIAEAIAADLDTDQLLGFVPVRAVAEACFNLAIGWATRRLIDPNVSSAGLFDLARLLLRAS
ncbi:Transcriptional regulator, TetR family [Alloactinosynnema sp. L-07]|uniref:TetR/AcrR family transcriptional regulator n=1 Tax=Alloactinosynnema sp. L-07 TaxID=1653480 RepID=UPI00065F021D|nr:TetR/AcrR family transcriptional regulator [Alloactinosynnema sp. L-07]CRK55998.1 Transcriptional regulator, TetR family [Alloactinosynnema sp. L-07]